MKFEKYKNQKGVEIQACEFIADNSPVENCKKFDGVQYEENKGYFYKNLNNEVQELRWGDFLVKNKLGFITVIKRSIFNNCYTPIKIADDEIIEIIENENKQKGLKNEKKKSR